MGERGVFITQVIYCDKCFIALKKILKKVVCEEDTFASFGRVDVIVGEIRGLYAGEEIQFIEDIAEEIEANICCDLRIAVLAEWGERIFRFIPKKREIINFNKNIDIRLRNLFDSLDKTCASLKDYRNGLDEKKLAIQKIEEKLKQERLGNGPPPEISTIINSENFNEHFTKEELLKINDNSL